MSKTPISVLQEVMVQRKEILPVYFIENFIDENGSACFKCTVKVASIEAIGFSSTKKDAKQNSAQKALEILGFYSNIKQESPAFVNSTTKRSPIVNYVGRLNEWASMHGKPYPIYNDNSISTNGIFKTECNFCGFVSEGFGMKKKDSKQDAARIILDKINNDDIHTSTIITSTRNLCLENSRNVDTFTQEIVKNYDKLKTVTNNGPSLCLEIPPLKKNIFSLDDFEKELNQYGYKYTLDTFQRNPYIMMIKISPTNAIIMGKGNSKQQALNDLLEYVILMFRYGFSLKPEF